ncbi:MAG: hypothetical protein R2745_17905 [Vicinamibacterales bacterium]
MPPTQDEIRPAKLWRSMTADRRTAAAAAFWNDENAALEQAEAIALIARQIKFRPKSVQMLPVDKRAKYLASIAQVSDLLAARLLVVYHLEFQRPMMGAFLDALGIAHKDGLIEEETPKAPEPAAVTAAADQLAAAFPKADVGRYFWTLLWQDPETWGALQDRPELAEVS